ncbi:MAG: hypothetical protein V1835_06595 [Candidatus Micrarchaeota archaeon]
MNMKAIGMALILLGVAFAALTVNQLNSMVVSNAQTEIAKPIAEAQIVASEEYARSYGQTEAEIAKSSADARALIDKTAAAMSNSYMLTSLIDGILALVLLFAGIFTYPKEH